MRLDVGGAEVAAVVSGAGDPLRWWSAIWEVAWPTATVRGSDLNLPPGLHSVAWRDPDGKLNFRVSDALPPARQRAALRRAMRACGGRGWRKLLPVPPAALPAPPGTRTADRARGAQLASWTAVAAVAAVLAAGAAGAYLAFAPQHQVRSASRTGVRFCLP